MHRRHGTTSTQAEVQGNVSQGKEAVKMKIFQNFWWTLGLSLLVFWAILELLDRYVVAP
jgi:hypothetical protein